MYPSRSSSARRLGPGDSGISSSSRSSPLAPPPQRRLEFVSADDEGVAFARVPGVSSPAAPPPAPPPSARMCASPGGTSPPSTAAPPLPAARVDAEPRRFAGLVRPPAQLPGANRSTAPGGTGAASVLARLPHVLSRRLQTVRQRPSSVNSSKPVVSLSSLPTASTETRFRHLGGETAFALALVMRAHHALGLVQHRDEAVGVVVRLVVDAHAALRGRQDLHVVAPLARHPPCPRVLHPPLRVRARAVPEARQQPVHALGFRGPAGAALRLRRDGTARGPRDRPGRDLPGSAASAHIALTIRRSPSYFFTYLHRSLRQDRDATRRVACTAGAWRTPSHRRGRSCR